MPPISSFVKDNALKMLYDLDEEMLQAHRDDRNDHAESTARILLQNADLPLLIRARACMVLGCSDAEDFLEMAKEGVRIAELGYENCTNPGDFEKQLVADCKTVYEQAQKDFEAMDDDEETEPVDAAIDDNAATAPAVAPTDNLQEDMEQDDEDDEDGDDDEDDEESMAIERSASRTLFDKVDDGDATKAFLAKLKRRDNKKKREEERKAAGLSAPPRRIRKKTDKAAGKNDGEKDDAGKATKSDEDKMEM